MLNNYKNKFRVKKELCRYVLTLTTVWTNLNWSLLTSNTLLEKIEYIVQAVNYKFL